MILMFEQFIKHNALSLFHQMTNKQMNIGLQPFSIKAVSACTLEHIDTRVN